MGTVVRKALATDVEAWARLRHQLWPSLSVAGHRQEVLDDLAEPETRVAFVALSDPGAVIGFAEASLRSEYVNGCNTSPVAFLEGIYVQPDHRRTRIASDLTDAVCAWARGLGVSEIASDAALDNTASHALHAALGFEETERVVYFRRAL